MTGASKRAGAALPATQQGKDSEERCARLIEVVADFDNDFAAAIPARRQTRGEGPMEHPARPRHGNPFEHRILAVGPDDDETRA